MKELNFRWEDPPNNMHRGTSPIDPNDPTFQQMRDNPKRWARLYDYESAGSAQSKAASLRKVLGEDFRFTARKLDDKTAAVFGCYVPAETLA